MIRCTSTYNGVAVPVDRRPRQERRRHRVQLAAGQGSADNKIIYQDFYHHYQQNSHAMRCQAIPDVVSVDKPQPSSGEETDTGYRCQVLVDVSLDQRRWTEVRLLMNNLGMVWRS